MIGPYECLKLTCPSCNTHRAGGGALGHPKVYINRDQPGPRSCGYCGLRFEQDPHHHGAHAAH
jgi:uncharacterized Zn-finger protein